MTQSGFLWMCYQNWSTLSILKILHFYNKVQKKAVYFGFWKNFGPKKVTVFLPTLPHI